MQTQNESLRKRQELELALYLKQYKPKNGTETKNVEQPSLVNVVTKNAKNDQDIAIIGMAGRFPNSPNLEQFWKNLEAGKNLIGQFPQDRWDWQYYQDIAGNEAFKVNIKHFGAIADIFDFDAKLFNISPREAETMDPHQRVMLEVVWETLEHAGYAPHQLSGTKTGVFIAMYNMDFLEYTQTAAWDKISRPYLFLGASQALSSNRISYVFNLQGPSEVIATACSSALVALHKAAQAIRSGECRTAIVGGVSLCLSPARLMGLNELGILSPHGYCAPFDKDSPGGVVGEGAGAVLLKSLAQAEQDGDTIYAVLKATGTNHHGNSSGSITMPSIHAQRNLIVDTYQKAHIDPASITFVEAHGSGNASGDLIEIKAFESAFATLAKKQSRPLPKQFCAVGSSKGNTGFLEAAGGIAQLIKTVLSLQHKTLPATLNFTALDSSIDIENSPFYIVEKTIPWPALNDDTGTELPRRAAINAYGLGGTNAHVVVEEYQGSGSNQLEVREQEPEIGPSLFVLSTKDENQLKEYAGKFVNFLSKAPVNLRLPDMAYTLQVGRAAMPERVAIVVTDTSMLLEKLISFGQGETSIEDLYRGRSKEKANLLINGEAGEAFIQTLVAQQDFHRLAQLWVSGFEIDWLLLHTDHSPRRMALPTYPFARERYWVTHREPSLANKKQRTLIVAENVNSLKSTLLADAPFIPNESSSNSNTGLLQPKITIDLKTMVAHLLKISSADISEVDSLTEYGLDSMAGIMVVNQLNTIYNLQLSPTLLFTHNTIETLSKYLTIEYSESLARYYQTSNTIETSAASGQTPAPLADVNKSLVPIRSAGTQLPFYCVHPWAGMIYPYYELAQALGADQPFYGLQAAGLYQEPHRTIEEMAAHYLDAIFTMQPNSPYLLGGWSLGGLIAYEMAQQIRQAGKDVALLALFDVPAPVFDEKTTRLSFMKFMLTDGLPHTWPYIQDYIQLKAHLDTSTHSISDKVQNPISSRLRSWLSTAKLIAAQTASLAKRDSDARRMLRLLNINITAASNYTPHSYPGAITLYRVDKQTSPDDESQTLGWNSLAEDRVTVHHLPGRHMTMLREPHVHALAQVLKSSIYQTQEVS